MLSQLLVRMNKIMNFNQAPQPAERFGIGKRISDLWNSGNKRVNLIILATTGLVLNCCCVIIPLSSKGNSPAAQSNVGVNAISTPAFTTAQDPFIPTALEIPANTEFNNNGGGGVICKIFNSQAAAQEALRVVHIQLDGSHMDGSSCKSLP
jgi:hypothetical protein